LARKFKGFVARARIFSGAEMRHRVEEWSAERRCTARLARKNISTSVERGDGRRASPHRAQR
jgi:hypothetical protein